MEKKKLACGDVVPGCKYVAEATTEDQLLQQVAKHAAESHGLKEVTPELLTKVKSVIKTEQQ